MRIFNVLAATVAIALLALVGCSDSNDNQAGSSGDGVDGVGGFGSVRDSTTSVHAIYSGGGSFDSAPAFDSMPDGLNTINVAFFSQVCKHTAQANGEACTKTGGAVSCPPYASDWIDAKSLAACEEAWETNILDSQGVQIQSALELHCVQTSQTDPSCRRNPQGEIEAVWFAIAEDVLYPNVNGTPLTGGELTPEKIKAEHNQRGTRFNMVVGGASNQGYGGNVPMADGEYVFPSAALILQQAEAWGFSGVDLNYEGAFGTPGLVQLINDLRAKAPDGFEIAITPYMGLWGQGSLKPDGTTYGSCPKKANASVQRDLFVAQGYHSVFSQAHESIDFVNMQYYAGWDGVDASKVVEWMTCGGPVDFPVSDSGDWGVGLDGDLRSEFVSKLVVGFQSDYQMPLYSSEYLAAYEKMPVSGFFVFEAVLESDKSYVMTNHLLNTPPGSNPGGE